MQSNKLNKYFYSLGAIGKDIFYVMVSLYLIVYITNVVKPNDSGLIFITSAVAILGVIASLVGILWGVVIDKTNSKLGKFKPGILIGTIFCAIAFLLLFSGVGSGKSIYPIIVALLYGIFYLMYSYFDVSYWGMIPALSKDPKELEKISSFSAAIACIGQALVVAIVVPVTTSRENHATWSILSIIMCIVAIISIIPLIVLVKETKHIPKAKTRVSDLFTIFKYNKQMRYGTLSNFLYFISYGIVSVFAYYYFQHFVRKVSLYAIFMVFAILITALIYLFFPIIRKMYKKSTLTHISLILFIIGILGYYFFYKYSIAVFLFTIPSIASLALLQMVLFVIRPDITDAEEKRSGKRQEGIMYSTYTVSIKLGNIIATWLVGITLVVANMNKESLTHNINHTNFNIFCFFFLIIPLIFMIISILTYKIYVKCKKAAESNDNPPKIEL